MKRKLDKVIRVAIAGQGRSGYSIHADWLRKDTAHYRIVAVADQIPGRRDDAAREFGAKTYGDWRPMIRAGGFDLLVNALPTPLHTPATIAAFAAGYDVVCEKPLARSVRDFDRMNRAAVKAVRLLAPFQNNRLQPFFLKILEVVQSGVLGEILHVRSHWGDFRRRWDWQTLQKNYGGVLFNTGPHAVDHALCFFEPDDTPDVSCRMRFRNRLGGDAEDLCDVTLHSEHGPIVEIHLTSYQAYPPSDVYTIAGTLGSLAGNAHALRWKYYDPRKAPKQKMWGWSVDRQYPSETLPWVEKKWDVDMGISKGARSGYTLPSFQEGVALFYNNVHSAMHSGAPLLITPAQVRRQIAVIEECHRQNRAAAKRARLHR